MNMQSQIDLFPMGTSYYSQILISLQIPPVPLTSPHHSSSGQDPGSQETRDQTWPWAEEGASGVPQCAQPGLKRQASRRAGRAVSCSSSNLWWQLTEPFCHAPDSSPRGTAAAAAKALSHLGRENQHGSNSHQTNCWIMMGINHNLTLDPRPEKVAGRKEPVLPPPAGLPESM